MKKELTPLLLLIGSCIVFIPISALGMVYNLCKSLKECFQVKFWKGLVKFILYWLNVLYQIWEVIKGFMVDKGVAVALDLFANATGGEMCEDVITTREDTWFGKGGRTLSAAIGKEEFEGFIVPSGWIVTGLLSKFLGKNHSVEAYHNELKK